jgi:hypothetical protein
VGDGAGAAGTYTGLTPPAVLPSLYAGIGTWYRSSDDSFSYLSLGDLSGGVEDLYYSRTVERYSYNLDGYQTTLTIAENVSPGTSSTDSLRARNVYDALGHLTSHEEFSAFNSVNAVASRTTQYDMRGRVTSDSNFVKRGNVITHPLEFRGQNTN